ncbi:MAG: 2OG-Fe(II) oxygenase [Erythrobacter sp.]
MLLQSVIVDDFLGAELAGTILDFALTHEAGFKPSAVISHKGEAMFKENHRKSLSFKGDITPITVPFGDAVERMCDRLRAEIVSVRFSPDLFDLELVAHCDGHMFKRHIDTAIGGERVLSPASRVLSLVYYMHTEPKPFSGGNLVLHSLIGDERRIIEPRHDRLVAFPSIAPHEVEPISVPSNAFADARFSIACWLCRPRADEASGAG